MVIHQTPDPRPGNVLKPNLNLVEVNFSTTTATSAGGLQSNLFQVFFFSIFFPSVLNLLEDILRLQEVYGFSLLFFWLPLGL